MASFLVETYIPTTTSLDEVERRVSRAAADLSTTRSRVRLVRSIYVTEDETCFLLFDATSADAVRRTSERAELGALHIVEAIDLPATMADGPRLAGSRRRQDSNLRATDTSSPQQRALGERANPIHPQGGRP